ncbi:Lrp/AsnC family transcriptional regulator [Candidatus Pacearchaeota archaeon]|nr:Lrp/AsnC family transcriptional regulator [Candidatus Pacearchaeota archaeon]
MTTLDLKDRKLLYQLDLNARQSNSKIAKKIGVSKDVAGYRIKNLEKYGIIRGYNTIIDSSKLGYLLYRVYLNLMNTTLEKQNSIINFLQKEKNVWWVAELDGAWNFLFAVWVKSNEEFRDFYKRFCLKFKQNIKEKLICPLIAYKQLNRSYLLQKEKIQKTEIIGVGKLEKHDDTDLKILRFLSQNAKIPLIEIAEKLKLDSMTILHRIKRLENDGIIQGYKADLNFSQIKREFYSVKINLNDISKLKEVEDYIKSIPETTAITEAIGSYDFEFDLEIENSGQYFKIVEDLKSKFSFIRELTYFRVIKNYKILYMPEI